MTRKTISSVMRYQFENDMYVSLISLFSFFFSFLFLLGPFINPFSLALSLRVAPDSASQRLCPRWSFELPRFPHPSARLALKPRGSALPVAPPDEVASCPASCIFGFCRRPSSSCLVSCPSALPWLKLGLPRSSSSGYASRCVPRVAPASASSGLAGNGSSSCPESRILQHPRRSSLKFPS